MHAGTVSALTNEQLRAEVATIIMGGFETTAHSLSFTIFCIATNKSAEDEVLSDLEKLGLLNHQKSHPKLLSFEDTKQMN